MILCLTMKFSVQQMVNQINMKTSQIQKMSLTLMTINKILTKVLPFKTRIITIITKNIVKLKDFVIYKILGSNDFQKAQIIKTAGKVSRKYSDWYNIKNLTDDTISSTDWKSVDKWKQYSQEEALINSLVNNFSDSYVTNAKLDELNE